MSINKKITEDNDSDSKATDNAIFTKVTDKFKLNKKVGVVAILVIIIIVFIVVVNTSSGESKTATNFIKDIMTETYEAYGYTVDKVTTSIIKSEKSSKKNPYYNGRYAVDVTISFTYQDGTKSTEGYYIPIWIYPSDGSAYGAGSDKSNRERFEVYFERYRYTKADADKEEILAKVLKELNIG